MSELLSAATAVEELERTLAVCEEARAALARALERALTELEKAREDASALKRREDELSRLGSDNVRLLGELERSAHGRREFEAERAKLLAEAARAMETAEQVRREGIEALEEARDLRKKG